MLQLHWGGIQLLAIITSCSICRTLPAWWGLKTVQVRGGEMSPWNFLHIKIWTVKFRYGLTGTYMYVTHKNLCSHRMSVIIKGCTHHVHTSVTVKWHDPKYSVNGHIHFMFSTFAVCSHYKGGNPQCNSMSHVCSSEGTEYWCGGCTLPLAMVLPDEEVQNHRPAFREEDGGEFVVSRPCEKTITMPIEPKVHTLCTHWYGMGHLQVQVAFHGNVWVKCWKVGLFCVTSVLDLLLPGTSHFVHPVVSQFKKQITVPRPRYATTISYFEKRFFKSACVLYVMVDLGSNLLIWYLPFTVTIK